MAVRQESVVADAGKSARQDVQQESADEFVRRERHGLLSVIVGVILPLEGDAPAVEGRQARIGDRRAMGVAGQILEHLLGAAKGWLGVDDPVGSDRLIKQALEGLAVGVLRSTPKKRSCPLRKACFSRAMNLPRKTRLRMRTGRKKLARPWIHCWPSAENPPAGTTQCRWG